MSCYWDVYCLTCDEEHGFENANHAEREMSELCANASQLASLGDAIVAFSNAQEIGIEINVTVGCSERRINLEFFRRHKGHELLARNEYGGFLNDCHQVFTCANCDTRHVCVLPPKHEGPHARKREASEVKR